MLAIYFHCFLLLSLLQPILSLPVEVFSEQYVGTWQKQTEQQIPQVSAFQSFNTKAGEIMVYFTDNNNEERMIIEFLNPSYYDQKVIKLEIKFSKSEKNQKHESGRTEAKYFIYENAQQIDYGVLDLEYLVGEQVGTLMFQVSEHKLQLWLEYKVEKTNPLITIVFALYSWLISYLVKRPGSILDTYHKHSIIPIILSIIFLFMVSAVQFVMGCGSLFGKMTPATFFIFSALVNFFICIHALKFYGGIVLKRRVLIILVWVLTFSYVSLLLFLRHSYVFFILNSFILVPEIVYHSRRGQRIKADWKFLLFIVSNQFYVLYFKSCPDNVFRQSPNYLLCYCLAGILLLQICIIVGQIRYGSRFFIPSFLLSSKHNYYDLQSVKKELSECFICLESMKDAKKSKLMITPCGHVFHADCLENWMVIRMTCPVDRSPLLPM